MKRLLLVSLALSALSACSGSEVGSKKRPFTMYFVPSVDAQQIATESQQLVEYVSKEVSQELYGKTDGFYVKSAVPTSYIAVVEAFGTNKADLAAVNTFSYILAKDIKKYPVDAIFSIVRGKDERTYKGQIIVRADSGIKSLKDLNGKKIAYTDPASTSGFILPAQLLKKEGVPPSETMFAQKHDNVVMMVYQKQVDAGATFYSPPEIVEENGKKIEKLRDARGRVATQFPDVGEKVKILAFTDEIPNEPWIMRTNLYKEDGAKSAKVREAVTRAITKFSLTNDGKRVLDLLYGVSGLAPTTDETFKEIRATVMQANLNLEQMLLDEAAKKKK